MSPLPPPAKRDTDGWCTDGRFASREAPRNKAGGGFHGAAVRQLDIFLTAEKNQQQKKQQQKKLQKQQQKKERQQLQQTQQKQHQARLVAAAAAAATASSSLFLGSTLKTKVGSAMPVGLTPKGAFEPPEPDDLLTI